MAQDKLNNGMLPSNQKGVADLLNTLLADAFTLYVKTLKFHWNVVGPNFSELHSLFGDQYEALQDAVDSIAERVRQMGGTTEGTMEEFLKKATIKEAPGENPDAMGMIKELLDGHETVIRALRVAIDKCFEEFKAQGTGNFLTDLMEKHEKTAWMLRSYTK